MASLSEQCPDTGSDDDYCGYDPGYLTGNQLAKKTGAGIHHCNKKAAADCNSRRHFENINQQRNEDEISRTKKANENSGDEGV